jgi:hypothetical protein
MGGDTTAGSSATGGSSSTPAPGLGSGSSGVACDAVPWAALIAIAKPAATGATDATGVVSVSRSQVCSS